MLEDRPYELIESQEVIVRPDEAPIGGLNLETSRRMARERLRIPAEPQDEVEMDDTCRNFKGYNTLLQLVSLWHLRLGHPGLDLLKKTTKITSDISNLDVIKEEDFVYLTYDRSKVIRRLNLRVFLDLLKILNTLKRDIFKIKPRLYNKRPVKLFIIDCKSRFKWVVLLPNRKKQIVFEAI